MGRECDDAILIWLRLQRGEKGQGDRRCRRGYIPRTRRSVAIDRQRSDMAGAGTAMSHVADLRKRAIELLAGELGLSKGEVERLPLDAYRDGMIAIAEGRATIALARETCSAVRAWLGARHSRSGKLFPRLRSRQRREAVTLPSHERLAKTVTDRARDMRRLEVEDTLRLLWAGVKNNARALIFMRVSERRGWDPAFVESLAKGLPAALRTTCNLTRRQVRTAQREITAAWDRHPDKDEYRARGKFKGRQL
jgi:hypothetical protein